MAAHRDPVAGQWPATLLLSPVQQHLGLHDEHAAHQEQVRHVVQGGAQLQDNNIIVRVGSKGTVTIVTPILRDVEC